MTAAQVLDILSDRYGDEVADYIVQHVIDTGYIDAEELIEIAGG